MDAGIIVAVVSGIIGLASAIYTARSAAKSQAAKTGADERVALRQIEADAYKRARESYEGVLKTNEGVLKSMQTEIDRQAKQINVLQGQVARLSRQVRTAGLVPVTSSEDET